MVNARLFEDVTFYIFPTRRERYVRGLQDLIEEYGGTVVDYHKQQIQEIVLNELDGYLLIDPAQVWAPEQLKKGTKKDQYNQNIAHYINWGYPQLCVDHDHLIQAERARDLLILNRTPGEDGGWVFYLSSSLSVGNEARQQKNRDRITDHGGRLTDDEEDANIIIVPHDELEDERERYSSNSFTRVESKGWLLDAIAEKYVRFTPPPREPLPGRTPIREGGQPRAPFTDEERQHFVKYLATVSEKEFQGLQGNNFYKELCDENSPRYRAWSRTHPWQSWQNQYKKNKERYNREIMLFRAEEIFDDGHGRHHRSRRNNQRVVKAPVGAQNTVEDEEDELEEEGSAPPPRKRPRRNGAEEKPRAKGRGISTGDDQLANEDVNSALGEYDDG
ncbi:hypothetical protein M408DRAFT_110628 [Serendipita vermifera MAFF 305830]|uniref:BRCT domain-containing protein n=1 Tax=Serendipita vermifera MAFF 305830 TaxID=933852 RepID=A0A0C2W414_SERVB|nr:hypothetical protein M408DRAFT_110628 [Serendipita vermifera MAFF 305830]